MTGARTAGAEMSIFFERMGKIVFLCGHGAGLIERTTRG
jgi:hypothetical protein